ncbi:MAG: CCA tRNA nucleotidyltransferase [Candidatus Aenigmatarchaeota archaeon]
MDLKSVLNELKPSKKEYKEMEDFIAKLTKLTGNLEKDVKPLVCGSVAKDTWISEKNEVDLFLLYDPKISKKELEKNGMILAKKIVKELKGKHEIAFAEHPYLKAQIGKYQVDIVPAYSIKDPEKIKSSVDRTPHHVKFVEKNLKKPDEVRLLKQFCIANKCYGADVKTLGFSGYLCELLIIKYGSFMKLAKDASKWRARYIIVFKNSNKEKAKKFKSPFIVVDPVDKNRNVGAAVSVEKFYIFINACKRFVDNPKREFFFPPETKPYSLEEVAKEIKKRGTRWYSISFERPKTVEDVLYPQMKRGKGAIDKILTQNGFNVLRSDFYCDKKCVMVFEMKAWQIPKITKNIGPDVYSSHAEEFLKHYKQNEVFIENEKWVVEVERKFTTVLHFLKDLLKKSEKDLRERGLPSKIAPNIRKAVIAGGGDFLKEVKKMPEDFRRFLREWFEKDINVV